MKKVYGFESYEKAIVYADKNYYSGTYKIIETTSGTFAIERINH